MRFILTLLLGVIVGATIVYVTLVGAPAAKPQPGTEVRPPDPGAPPPGTAIITLDEAFFNTLLGTIFDDLGAPAFPLAADGGGCANRLTIKKEGTGVQTGVRLVNGQVTAPLAFSGERALPVVGCQAFNGWAQANIALRFDAATQTLYGNINVEGVNLEGLNPVVGNFITPVVQNAINERVNPLRILSAPQLNLAVPVAATGGTLQAQVTDVRADITDALRLHITYDFNGQK